MKLPSVARISRCAWRLVAKRLQRCTWRSFTVCLILMTVFFNEFLVYRLQAWRWPTLPAKYNDRMKDDEMVLLVVADPQVQGYVNEADFPFGTLYRWDSDRYLQKTFDLVYKYSQPDVVIFLGDIMDEGSIAYDEQYADYFQRVLDIFTVENGIEKIYIPGDNDIGGELFDRRTNAKIKRYTEHFDSLTGVVNVDFINFIKMDIRLQDGYLVAKKKLAMKIASKIDMKGKVRILINHETVSPIDKLNIFPILQQLQPHLILSGHWHRSIHFICEECMLDNSIEWPVHRRDLQDINEYIQLDLRNLLTINELMIPTCSYRMETADIGYGVIVIESNRMMKYTVAWSPSRFSAFYLYEIEAIVLVILFILYQCYPLMRT